jgi:UDP:flavonoid glycosyltransferase YjiC (YdhE family)
VKRDIDVYSISEKMMWAKCLLIGLPSFLLLATHYQTDGARILLLTTVETMNSHVLEQLALGEELVSRGHEVAIPLCPNEVPPPPANSSKPTVQHLNYCSGQPSYSLLGNLLQKNMAKQTQREQQAIIHTVFSLSTQRVLENIEFVQSLKDMKFDLAVVDGFHLVPYLTVIAHVLRLPYVTISAQIPMYVGASPLIPSIYSNYYISQNTFPRSFAYRLQNLWAQIEFMIEFQFFNKGQYLLTQFAPDVNNFQDLIDRSLMFFVTRDHIIDHPQPYFPNVISTSSLLYSPPKPLSGEFKQVYSQATNGVIVVSFGSMPHITATKEVLEKMMAAFGQLNETVVFKLKKSVDLPELPKNVKVFAWLPQNDCLADERTKLFITHGGTNGIYEALYHGVPMIGFPFYLDQPYNIRFIESRGYAIMMGFESLTTEILVSNIRQILTNPSYAANVKKASAILKDRPMTSRQTVAYWIEHIIKHGHQHLRSHAIDLAWYEYFMVDVFVFLLGTFAFGAVLVYCSVRYACDLILKLKHRHATKLKAN